jgi:hypothetical protein
VFENTVTGAQMAWTHDSASGSFDFIQMYIRMSPEIGFSGGSNTLHPTASDQQDSVVQADWIGTNTPANRSWHSHLIISNDGHVTFHFTTIANRISQACILQKVPVSADLTGATRPWSGNQNIMMWESYVDSTVWTLDGFTDNAIFRGTIDHAGADGGPYVAAFYATTELASASQLPEVQGNQPTHLDPNKWQFYRMGLITLSTNVRGARGRLLDIFAVNEATNGNAAQGSYYPGDLTRARLKVGHYLLPWNGSTLRKG